MSAERPVGRRLLWCLRHYAWVVVVCVLALAAAPLLVTPAAPVYQAEALVVARQLTLNRVVLPQLAEAVFADGPVAAAAATDPSIGGNPRGLVPDRLSVVAAEDSIALRVQARDADAATAARLANLAAEAFVVELNRPGAGVGSFALQSAATVPVAPVGTALSQQTLAAIGALGGALLGLGLIALIAVIRRPVITSHDVQDAVGVPLVGTVQPPRAAPGTYAGPLGVRGIATVARSVAAVPPGRLLLVSSPSAVSSPAAAWIRDRIYVMVAVALWTVRPVRFEASSDVVGVVRKLIDEQREAGRPIRPGMRTGGELVLVDGGSALELLDPAEATVSVLAVAKLGVPRRRLRALAADYREGGLMGVVLVDVRPGIRRAATRRARTAATARAQDSGVQRLKDIPEPERA